MAPAETPARRELDAASPDAATRPIQTKLVLLGEAAVGKTSVVHRFVQDDFQENREPTIGAAFLTVGGRTQADPRSSGAVSRTA